MPWWAVAPAHPGTSHRSSGKRHRLRRSSLEDQGKPRPVSLDQHISRRIAGIGVADAHPRCARTDTRELAPDGRDGQRAVKSNRIQADRVGHCCRSKLKNKSQQSLQAGKDILKKHEVRTGAVKPRFVPQFETLYKLLKRFLERVKGIEPSYSAWEAAALPLSYTRVRARFPTEGARCQAARLAVISGSVSRASSPVPDSSIPGRSRIGSMDAPACVRRRDGRRSGHPRG